MGGDWYTTAINTLENQGYGAEYYSPQEGTGVFLGRGIEYDIEYFEEVPVPVIRIAIWGGSESQFHQFADWEEEFPAGGRSRCSMGLGGVLPILIKEYETDPGWTWGDMVVMFGDGWDPNVGPNQAPTGIGNPDIVCQDGGPDGDCSERSYRTPPAPDGSQVNTLKDVVMDYMLFGYDGPLHDPGTFIPRQSGLSNNQTVRAFMTAHQVGDYVAVMVINDGDVYSGEKGFDNVEIIGYAIFQIDDSDANTVWGHPVTEILSATEISNYPIDPTMLGWE
jgi:hypothetical protein